MNSGHCGKIFKSMYINGDYYRKSKEEGHMLVNPSFYIPFFSHEAGKKVQHGVSSIESFRHIAFNSSMVQHYVHSVIIG